MDSTAVRKVRRAARSIGAAVRAHRSASARSMTFDGCGATSPSSGMNSENRSFCAWALVRSRVRPYTSGK